MRVLILGVKGMAGHMIALYLKSKQYDVVGFAREKVDFCECIEGNALDTQQIKEIFDKYHFDVVINCIGVLNQSVDLNKAEGIFLNSYLPHFIAKCIQDKRTKLIHISTDCVFSGKAGNYLEESHTDSYSLYGQSKALGEIKDNKNLTIRTSIIGPDQNENGIGLMNWFLKQGKSVNGYTKAIWTGVTTLTLAQAIEVAMNQNITGLYHLVNNERISKFDLLQLMNEEIRERRIMIEPNEDFCVDKSLVNTRIDLEFVVPSYRKMLREVKVWIDEHRELYKHYL